jgi:hypothetical protein
LFTKLVNDNQTNWNEHLPTVLFSYRTAFKVSTGYTPFQLVYGLHPLMPTEYIVPTRRTDGALDFTPTCVLTACLANLEQMDSARHHAQQVVGERQWSRALWNQQHYRQKDFQLGDSILWYPKGQKEHVGKFKSRWFGPYIIQYRLSNNTALLVTVAYFQPDPIIVNINKLKPYRFYEDQQLVTIEPKKSPKGLDDHQKGDNITLDNVEGQSTLVVEVQGIGQQTMAEWTKEAEQKIGTEKEEGRTTAPTEKETTRRKKIVAEKEKENIFCGMVGIISIKIKEEHAEEARGQNPQRDEILADGGLSSDRGRRQLGFGEVTKATPTQEGAIFCHCC